jgi:hypothetical protein
VSQYPLYPNLAIYTNATGTKTERVSPGKWKAIRFEPTGDEVSQGLGVGEKDWLSDHEASSNSTLSRGWGRSPGLPECGICSCVLDDSRKPPRRRKLSQAKSAYIHRLFRFYFLTPCHSKSSPLFSATNNPAFECSAV